MRVAILLPGLLRSYEKSYETFNSKILQPNKDCEIDIFPAFWTVTHQRHGNKIIKKKEIKPSQIQKFLDLYKPTRFQKMSDYWHKNEYFKKIGSEVYSHLFERDLRHDSKIYARASKMKSISGKEHGIGNYPNYVINGLVAQSYVWKKSFSLIEKEYDLVVKSRFDIRFREEIIFRDMIEDAVYCCGRYKKTSLPTKDTPRELVRAKLKSATQWDNFGFCDIFFAGSQENMRQIMCDYHDLIIEKQFEPWDLAEKEFYCELFLKNIIQNEYNIEIKPIGNASSIDLDHKFITRK